MNLRPNNSKYRKAHRSKVSELIKKNQIVKKPKLMRTTSNIVEWANKLSNNGLIIEAQENIKLKNYQIQVILSILKKETKKIASLAPTKIINNTFPQIPVTKKPAEVRQGQGKGPVEFHINKVRKKKILFILKPILSSIKTRKWTLSEQKEAIIKWTKQIHLIFAKIKYVLPIKVKLLDLSFVLQKTLLAKSSRSFDSFELEQKNHILSEGISEKSFSSSKLEISNRILSKKFYQK